jgi:hypothetical protein
VNTSKTKVVICSKRKYRPEVNLKLDGIELDYTDAYLYLGVLFHYTGSVNFAKKNPKRRYMMSITTFETFDYQLTFN